ncbi:hypothetical protein [Streptomyces mirabilis]|uniref:hypothetical protein n=1 Tax=Streptomyces mirabilis TaxID=68239 RepID=UPI00369395A7
MLQVLHGQADDLDPAALPLKVSVSVIGVSAAVSVVGSVHFEDDCPSVPQHDDVRCPGVASLQPYSGEGRDGDGAIGLSSGLDLLERLINVVLLAAAERETVFYWMVGRQPLLAGLIGRPLVGALPQVFAPVVGNGRQDLFDVHAVGCRVAVA